MRLASFIEANMEAILSEWEDFAKTLLPAAGGVDIPALRDHAEEILHAVVQGLRTEQSPSEQTAKSRGAAFRAWNAPDSAAQTHGLLRATSGFTLKQLIAEYRALRATVLRQWAQTHMQGPDALSDMNRFNEAIDQAIAESVDFFAQETERWRNVFLGVLGHDLRGPLNAILLTSQVIRKLNDGTPASELASRLINGGERMKLLLDDLLDFSRTSLSLGIPIAPTNLDLVRVCQEEVELQRAASPTHQIEFASDRAVEGFWDGTRVKQLLGNLISNAAKYGSAGTPINVRLVDNETEVTLAVENRGPTIPAASVNLIFEPLRRDAHVDDDSERTSLGLGLFIVREIARAHGGAVEVSSADEQTVFMVRLPRQF